MNMVVTLPKMVAYRRARMKRELSFILDVKYLFVLF